MTHILVFQPAENFNLTQCPLTVCPVLKRDDFLDGYALFGFVIESRAVKRTTKKNNKTSKLNKMGEFHEWRNVEAISHQTMPYAPSPI